MGRASEASEEEKRSDDSEEVYYDRMKIYIDPLTEIQEYLHPKGVTQSYRWGANP